MRARRVAARSERARGRDGSGLHRRDRRDALRARQGLVADEPLGSQLRRRRARDRGRRAAKPRHRRPHAVPEPLAPPRRSRRTSASRTCASRRPCTWAAPARSRRCSTRRWPSPPAPPSYVLLPGGLERLLGRARRADGHRRTPRRCPAAASRATTTSRTGSRRRRSGTR